MRSGPVALRFALRELRGGLRGFRILILCLALGVAAIAAVGSVRGAIESGLGREAATLLGGDAEIEFTYRFASPEERAWMADAAETVSEIVDFRSMLALPARPDSSPTLVQVKAVDGAYPLFGTLALEDGGSLAAALAERDGLPGLVADPVLIDRLGLAEGDRLRLGSRDFRLSGRIAREPDSAARGVSFGPRVIVSRADLEGSGLLSEGALFDSSYRLRLAPDADLDALRTEARARFADNGLQWRDRRNGTPGLTRFVDRLGAFLVLLGLAGLAVGGVGVSAAVKSHLDGKTETIATLKTLGATGRTIFATYLLQIGMLAAIGIALGLAIGAAAPMLAAPFIAGRLPVPLDTGLQPGPLAEAALYGALTALIFTLWPLARAREIRAAELFRDIGSGRRRPRATDILIVAALAALLVGVATWASGAPRLALTTAGGVIGALAILRLAYTGLVSGFVRLFVSWHCMIMLLDVLRRETSDRPWLLLLTPCSPRPLGGERAWWLAP